MLLIGEIDLSVGYVSGLAGVCVAWFQEPGTGHHVPGLVAIVLAIGLGALVGALQGSFVALLGVPSFVVTLAGLLAWQGVIIKWIGDSGVDRDPGPLVNDTANYFLPKTAGWIVAALVSAAFAATALGDDRVPAPAPGLPIGNPVAGADPRRLRRARRLRRRRDLQPRARRPVRRAARRLRCSRSGRSSRTRTTFGRHVYAVGGNAEAARRAGISVAVHPDLVFMISGAMAGLGGIVFAARLVAST